MFGFIRTVFAAISFGAIISFPAISAEDATLQKVPEFKVPDDVQSDGAFRYSMPLNLPEFRGLVPKFGLSYNSSFKGHGSPEVWLGAGWRLSGFSSIERVTIGNGTPTYNDSRDLYRLDGVELLACSDVAATNPWPATRNYPDRYKTDAPSASCSAGGNLAPIVENYRKIEIKQQPYGGGQVDYFVVTARDGTQYRYDSIGVLAGETLIPTTWKRYGVLFQRKFLLSEIRDTQTTPNVVSISYDFSSKTKGLAHRPRHISYGGYNVWFNYSYQDKPLATYATGTAGFLGEQNWRLESVVVRDGTMPVRAYGFDYTHSAQSETTLLSGLRAYGKVFTKSGAVISGGNELPSPLKNLTYSADQTSFTEVEYPNENFHRGLRVFDYDRDGQEELIFPQVTSLNAYYGGQGDDTVAIPAYTLGSEELDVRYNRSINPMVLHPVLSTLQTQTTYEDGALQGEPNWEGEALLGFTGYQPSEDNSYFFTLRRDDTHSRAGVLYNRIGYNAFPATQSEEGQLSNVQLSDLLVDPHPFSYIFGNFDDEPGIEALQQLPGQLNSTINYLYNIQNGTFTNTIATTLMFGAGKAADIDGDGVTEIITPRRLGGVTPGGVCHNIGAEWTVADSYNGAFHVSNIGFPDHCLLYNQKIKTAYGDVNGDGAADLIMFNIRYNASERVYVAISSGSGFEDAILWADNSSFPILGTHDWWYDQQIIYGTPFNDGGNIQLRDVNGDGLDDIVVFEGNAIASISSSQSRYLKYGAQAAHIFLSNGTSFVPFDGTVSNTFQDFVGVADVDGDGLADIISEKELTGHWSGTEIRHSRINYNSGVAPNRLTSLTDSKGGITRIEYAPSTSDIAGNNNNNVPGVYQLVSAIERDNGRGDIRRTTFSYVNSKYDYNNRKPLGYQTVTANLPAIIGETTGPKVITTYLNNHIAEHGRVKSRLVTVGGTSTWTKRINSWIVTTNGNGPYRAQKVQTRQATRYGPDMVETKKSYVYDVYGNPLTITEHGFSDNLTGANLAPGDDMTTSFEYAQNLSKYIVNLPKSKRSEPGTASTWNWSNFLAFESYSYDGAANENTTPTKGNLTKTRFWTGNPSTPNIRRVVQVLTYDNYGNILSETNARGFATTHTYDTARHLFRTGTSNALGHSETTVWDTTCQAPQSTANINGQVTSFEYDEFCRETKKTLPNGQYVITSYHNLGMPYGQYIRRYSRSASNVSGKLITDSREYFDGFGETYKTATSGDNSSAANLTLSLVGYDKRGNKAWESIPVSWADAVNNQVASNKRTMFEYDTLGRIAKTIYADGNYARVDYSARVVGRYGPLVATPSTRTRNTDCFDGDPVTVCNDLYRLYDNHGNLIREDRHDVAQTDVNTGASSWRSTAYLFDLRDNLTYVSDPAGSHWNYTYDIFGNRTVASDPDLGLWTLSYDDNNNLISQFDAKGQEIHFTYDALDRVTDKSVYKSDGTLESRILSTYDEPHTAYSNIGQLTYVSDLDGNAIRYYYNKGQGLLQREHHLIDGKTYVVHRNFRATGDLHSILLPSEPGTTNRAWLPAMEYDAANRLKSFGNLITNIDYDLRGNPTQATFGNGTSETRSYSPTRGWIDVIDIFDADLTRKERTQYYRAASGRVTRQRTNRPEGRFDYAYDYAGRLLAATNWGGAVGYDQTFTYDAAGSMRSNSALGAYSYDVPTAAHPHAPTGVGFDQFTYDANGNMTTGLGGKVMTYDAENRPLTVSHNGTTTTYVYGPDGTRLKKTEGTDTTVYFGPVEIRHFGQGAASEEILLYPHPNVRIRHKAGDPAEGVAAYLHTDQLGSVRMVTDDDPDADGSMVARETTYRPFGEAVEFAVSLTPPETKGFIGERFDADAGLQYLNARYYDPRLGMFIQSDWFEVTKPGVGTNRYAYSFNDPVNLSDPGGNCGPCALALPLIADYIGLTGLFGLTVGETAAVVTGAAVATGVAVNSKGKLGQGSQASNPLNDTATGNTTGNIGPVGNGVSGHWGVNSEQETGDIEVIPAEETNNKGTASKPSYQGKPETVQAGSFQDRLYGPDGKPAVDVDWDSDHEGYGRPHSHDWKDGKRTTGRESTDKETSWTGADRDPETGRLNE